jgi:hypothetical protein
MANTTEPVVIAVFPFIVASFSRGLYSLMDTVYLQDLHIADAISD